MSLESAKAFYSDVTSGKVKIDLTKINGQKGSDAMAYALSHGYDFTEAEMLESLSFHGKPLTMEEAKAIAGGGSTTAAVAGGAAGGAACA